MESALEILAVSFGQFPQVLQLNPCFRPDVPRIKVVLEIATDGANYIRYFVQVYRELLRWFPTLARHECCQWGIMPLFAQELRGVAIKAVGEVADVAHLVEHMMVDLHCSVGGMQQCSGITCGYKKPENRFDLFVECPEFRLGIFTAIFTTYVAQQLFRRRRVSPGYRRVLDLARFVRKYPERAITPIKIAEHFGWSKRQSAFAIRKLTEFHYLSNGFAYEKL